MRGQVDSGTDRIEVHQATSSSRVRAYRHVNTRKVRRIQRRHSSRDAGIGHHYHRIHAQPLLPGAFHHVPGERVVDVDGA